jgi:hypothetical protein
LCRPRFFAGQLLTEEDLNRLDRYIVGKSKLHNRYLQGWGVVCGLEVVCHPCKDEVIVRPGYALSPCGEDIVVCDQVTVPICDLINACNEQERRQWECEPYPYGRGDDCKDGCRDYILSIRYDEKPSRGVVPLKMGGSACCSRCGGTSGNGKKSSCGCSAQSNGNGASRSSISTKRTPQQCEPTATCEGFKFDVSREKTSQASLLGSVPNNIRGSWTPGMLTPISTAGPFPLGSLGKWGSYQLDPLRLCLAELTATVPHIPDGDPPSKEAMHDWCCGVKQALIDYLQTHTTYDCQLDEKLAAFVCPPVPQEMSAGDYYKLVVASMNGLMELGTSYLQYCMCSRLIPPCPGPVEDPRVPLAKITVCGDDCRVVRVCNVGVRKYVLTFPLIEYFLGGLGLGNIWQRRLDEICCPDEVEEPQPKPGLGTPERVGEMVGKIAGFERTVRRVTVTADVPEARMRTFSRMVVENLARPERRLDTFTLLAGAIGARDEAGVPLANSFELENPMQALLVKGLVAPILQSLIPQGAHEVVQPFAAKVADAATAAEEGTDAVVARVQTEVEALRKTVADQQDSISSLLDELKRMRDNKG